MPNEPEDAKKVPNDVPEETGSIDTSPDSYRPPKSDLSYKKPNPAKKWLVIILAILLIAAIAWAVYYFVSSAMVPKESAKDTPTHFASAKALVDQATQPLDGESVDVYLTNGLGGKTVDGLGVYGMASKKIGDRKFANLPTKSTGAGYRGDSATAAKDYAALVTFFKDNRFHLVSSGTDASGPISWTSDNISYISYATYSSDDVLCMVWHADASQTKIAAHVASIGCGDTSSYEAAAKELDAFYTAYAKSLTGDTNSGGIVLGNPEVTKGADGYERAVLYQENPKELEDIQFEGLYYREVGQKDWSYFLGTHGLVYCSEFDTAAVQKAFKDTECENESTQAVEKVTVKL